MVELMVAATILTIVGLGSLSGLLQARRMTEGSIYQATATTIAQGYIEQLKNMEFTLLDRNQLTELRNQGSPDTLSVSPLPSDPEVGNPNSDIINRRSIDINNTPETAQDDLTMDFVLYIENITDEANGIAEARRLILRWSYVSNTNGAAIPVGNTLYAVRSQIPTF